ncbi:hypothetical protein A2U01_0118956, partial [Trifolium medium]|nr:hypothetical protein [Trifolium medium]
MGVGNWKLNVCKLTGEEFETVTIGSGGGKILK